MICSCSNFTEAPIHFFNCPSLSVINCTFFNNTGTSHHFIRSFEGNSGGLSYGWNNQLLDYQSAINVYISNCLFYKNSAKGQYRSSNDVVKGRKFTGRGGGVSLIFNTNNPVNVTIEHTMFKENSANVIGGGIYILFSGISVNQSFNIYNNTFSSNIARTGAAAIVFAYLSSISATDISITHVRDCLFIGNVGTIGAISIYMTYTSGRTKNFRFTNCKFYYNKAYVFGAAFGLHHAYAFISKSDVLPLEITDRLVLWIILLYVYCYYSEFVGNIVGKGGTVDIAYFPVSFYGNITFSNNSGPALRVSMFITLNQDSW